MSVISGKPKNKAILWKETIMLNLYRNFCAGISLGILFIIIKIVAQDNEALRGAPVWLGLAYPFSYPVAFFFILPFDRIANFFTKNGSGLLGTVTALVARLFALSIMLGDPIMSQIHKRKPGLLPVDNYRTFEFALVLYVVPNIN